MNQRQAIAFAATAACMVSLVHPAIAAAASPPAAEFVIWRFNGHSHGGSVPMAALTESKKRVLFGTTTGQLSKSGHGTAFTVKLTPMGWEQRTIYEFKGGADGSGPASNLIGDASKALFGTTASGGQLSGQNGAPQAGTVFEITPSPGNQEWTEHVIYRLQAGSLATPTGPLVKGRDGTLYGTAVNGGAAGYGGIFALSPPANGQTGWTPAIIYSFQGGTDGASPLAGLFMGPSGALYGTTGLGGGANNNNTCPDSFGETGCGTVFQLTPPAPGHTAWVEKVLYAFTGAGTDGVFPASTLVSDASGSLYGTTNSGGPPGGSDYGNVFKLSPPQPGQHAWTETSIFQFTGANGELPLGSVVFGPNGLLYGATYYGGANGLGNVFSLTPPAPGQTSWTETDLHDFAGNADGQNPAAALLLDAAGNIFGTTSAGGNNGGSYGTVFAILP